jgi:replication-associated recombination protein RarA
MLQLVEKLELLATAIASLHSKLILLVGSQSTGKTSLLKAFGKRVEAEPLNVGSQLGLRLAGLSQKQRPIEAISLLRELADQHAKDDLLLLDNIEILFDRSLQLDPLDLLKRQAQVRCVVAVWPGDLHDGRLTYAVMGHPEHQDYGNDGFVPFEVQQ